MTDPLVTLTTDFGVDSSYVAQMKAIILGVNPRARLADLTHSIAPQDVRQAAFFLAATVPYFPAGTIHVVVVDPGVGTKRELFLIEAGTTKMVVPDNGCWTAIQWASGVNPTVRCLREKRFWRADVSATFHGRDIFAPVAAWLSLGQAPTEFGPVTSEWVSLELPQPRKLPNGWQGEVLHVDSFGNLITNIPIKAVEAAPNSVGLGPSQRSKAIRCVRTYGDAAPGTLVVLGSSQGFLEIAVVQGNAAKRLGANVGTPIRVSRKGTASKR
jgi:S-adenosylmethionine hydrolase